jgi:transposase
MTGGPGRNHSPAFKAKEALAAIPGEMTITEMAREFDLHANQITQWKTQMLEHAAGVFEDGSSSGTLLVGVNRLHAKVEELALQNDFLEGVPTKAGWLSAKR